MQIKLWKNFNKRNNSTKRPTDASAITINATLKAPTSIENPTFTILGNDTEYNEAYAFGHYYFIDNIIQNTNGTSDLVCTQDEGATFKSNIGSYRGLIDYAAVSNNVQITDSRNMPTQDIVYEQTEFSVFTELSQTGFFLLGVMNNQASVAGGVTYYALDVANMGYLKGALSTKEIWEQIEMKFNDVTSCLVSCTWLPLNRNALIDTNHLDSGSLVYVGNIGLNDYEGHFVTGSKLINRVINITPGDHTITFPTDNTARPFHQGGFTYLDKAPYTTGEIYLPFVGTVPLDLDIIAPARKVTIGAAVDIVTGDVVYSFNKNGKVVQTYSGNMATKIPMSAASFDGVGIATGIIGTIGGAVSGAVGGYAMGGAAGAAVGGISALTTGAVATAKSAEIHASLNGSVSSSLGAALGLKPQVTIWTYAPTQPNLDAWRAEMGLPYYMVNTVSNCPGYVQTHNASISLPSLGNDRDAVNSFMDSGFYYE